MTAESWNAFYHSDLQAVYALLVAPALFLVYWFATSRQSQRADPRDRVEVPGPGDRFVRVYALVFCLLTLLDPIATGPLTRFAELGDGGSTAVMLLFVLLGDFRVFLPVLFLTRPSDGPAAALRGAALLTAIVPIGAYATYLALGAIFLDLHGQVLWIAYELGFLCLALVLRSFVIPRRVADSHSRARMALRRATAYVAVYYSLWAASDLLIIGAGLDIGWLLRVVPNQLYYSFWIPFFYFCWFSRR